MLAPLAVVILACTGLAAAWLDLTVRRLPNALSAAVAGLGLLFSASSSDWAATGSAALHAVIALLIGLALYSRGVIGGGDVKYYAAVAAWFPLATGFRLLGYVSLAGLGVVAGWYLCQRLLTRPDETEPAAASAQVPFGIAIAAGALLAAAIP